MAGGCGHARANCHVPICVNEAPTGSVEDRVAVAVVIEIAVLVGSTHKRVLYQIPIGIDEGSLGSAEDWLASTVQVRRGVPVGCGHTRVLYRIPIGIDEGSLGSVEDRLVRAAVPVTVATLVGGGHERVLCRLCWRRLRTALILHKALPGGREVVPTSSPVRRLPLSVVHLRSTA